MRRSEPVRILYRDGSEGTTQLYGNPEDLRVIMRPSHCRGGEATLFYRGGEGPYYYREVGYEGHNG